jgi:hypothetical protein
LRRWNRLARDRSAMRASGGRNQSKRASGGQPEKRTAFVASELARRRMENLKSRGADHSICLFTCFDPFWVL